MLGICVRWDVMDYLSFDQFAEFIREHWSVSRRKQIMPETQFERDLGLTGDDGQDLLRATEKRFGVSLCSEETGVRETFNLGPNEYLFNSEGLDLFPFRLTSLFGREEYTVRKFTVGELFEAVQKRKLHEAQRALCEQYGAKLAVTTDHDKIGFAASTSGLRPINGLRHPVTPGTSGWYVWCGESFSEAADFFEPQHAKHVYGRMPYIGHLLGLPPGFRFLWTEQHLDVWFDENLLKV